MDCSPSSSSVLGISQARMLEWISGSFSRGIVLTQGSNLRLLHCRRILYPLSHWGSPKQGTTFYWSHLEFVNAQNYGHDVTSTRDCLLSGNSKKSQTRESTEKWAGLWKTVMEAVFSSSIFPDFSDAATITVCERNGRVRGGTQLPCCRRGRSEELCLPHAASTHIRSCMTIQWPSRKGHSHHLRDWLWKRLSSIPWVSVCGKHSKRGFFFPSHWTLHTLHAHSGNSSSLGPSLLNISVGKWALFHRSELSK